VSTWTVGAPIDQWLIYQDTDICWLWTTAMIRDVPLPATATNGPFIPFLTHFTYSQVINTMQQMCLLPQSHEVIAPFLCLIVGCPDGDFSKSLFFNPFTDSLDNESCLSWGERDTFLIIKPLICYVKFTSTRWILFLWKRDWRSSHGDVIVHPLWREFRLLNSG
jgi:hypothetical protein